MASGCAPDGTWSWQVKWGCRQNWLGSVRGLNTLIPSAFARRFPDGVLATVRMLHGCAGRLPSVPLGS